MTTTNYQRLIERLDSFIRKYYTNQLLRGLVYSSGLVLLFYLSLTVLEYFAHFNTSIRTILFYSFIISSGFIFTKFIVIPLTKLYKLGKIISYDEAANIIGKHFPIVQDKLLNALQLQQQTSEISTPQHQFSLLEASINQKINELKPVEFNSAINFSENRKYLKYVLIPISLIVVLLFSAPSIIRDGTIRLVKHTDYFEKKSNFQFVISNSDLKTVMQEDFELNVKIIGDEIPDIIYVEIEGNEFQLEKQNNFNPLNNENV